VRIFLLGTTLATGTDGRPVPVGGPRLRALLTVLALRAGRTVPVGVLVGEVWGAEPPADAVGALQALIGRLRRAVGAGLVRSVDGGYLLAAEPDAVDVHRFTRLAREGTAALDAGDPAKALDLLDDALALWRGPALLDLPDRGAETARLDARLLEARRTRPAVLLALGRPAAALPELAALCGEHPLDEPLQALRIRALRDSGRPAEALAAYEEVRRLLADRLGTDPGTALRALHAELLAGPGAAAPARTAPAAGGSGGRPPGPAGSAPLPSRPPGNLRARLTSFVGRDGDLAAIRGDLRTARLVTLLGPGGSGKTRLSQEAAESAGADYPDGVWLAGLAPVDDPAGVPDAVLTALGARETVLRGGGAEELRAATEPEPRDTLDRLVEHCAGRRMLLILDNCEHLVDAAAGLTERLLGECPGLTVLATSREPLGVPGEHIRPVDPLPGPMALRLLADRGAAARPGYSPEADRESAEEICRRLDGLPLAIELAAARLRFLTPRQIADRLDDRFRLLTSGSRTVLPRQQTLRAVVDWSWELLDDAERTVLRRLSVFAGGCGLTAAEAVCAGPEAGRPGPDVATALASLIDKSLVVAAPDDTGEMRYRLLETVAEYAAGRLAEAGERGAAERRHLVHYRELARAAEPLLRGREQLAAIALFEREYENLRTAFRRAAAARDEHELLLLVHCLGWYWQMRDLRSEALHWSTAARELGPEPFTPGTGTAPPVATPVTDHTPPLPPDILDEARRGNELIRLASRHSFAHWAEPGVKAAMRVIAATYRPGLPQTCRFPGNSWFVAVLFSEDGQALQRLLNGTVDACRAAGYEWELAMALHTRAYVFANRSQWAGDAAEDAEEALAIYRRFGDDWGAAEALSSRAEARERGGDLEGAADDYRAANRLAERIGAQAQVAVLTARLGGLLMELGRGDEGEALVREVIAGQKGTAGEAGAFARILLGTWLGRTGRRDEARAELELLFDHYRWNTMAVFSGLVTGCLAWLDFEDGEYGVALDRARSALGAARDPLAQIVAPQLVSAHLAAAAAALAVAGPGRAADAARLLAVADAELPPGHVATSLEREKRAQAESVVRSVLGDAAYATAFESGRGLTLDRAQALLGPPSGDTCDGVPGASATG
jgi:predicted ATPase/DNA-binding SARP family transcriptional activator